MFSEPGRLAPVHIVGLAVTPLCREQDAMLDELAFDALSAALRECALRKQEIGLSVLASLDALDGRSISAGLTTAAAGGYLRDSYRVEGDSGLAIITAAQAIASGDAEVAVAVGVYNPEITGSDEQRRSFLTHISGLAFDPIFDRPVGMTATATWAMHAARLVEAGEATPQRYAEIAAELINRGAAGTRAIRREPVTAADVERSPLVAWPLRELMLPVESTGAVAVVLASPARAARAKGRDAALVGVGHATGASAGSGQWLSDPVGPTAEAADRAYATAGLAAPHEQVDVVELSAPTPALYGAVASALRLDALPAERICPSGGLASNYPGLLNGAVRLAEALDWLDAHPGGSGRAVTHSVDALSGLVAQDTTVLVVEGT